MLTLFNTLSRKEEIFVPVDPNSIKMYVCGPTVYSRPHLGNARSIVFYDILYRLLKTLYHQVIYVRNITDVENKILKRAGEENITPFQLTERVINEFNEDTLSLNCLSPSFQPKVTENIAGIIDMISILIQKGHAYHNEGDIFFSAESFKDYGKLSGKKLEDLYAGVRIDISEKKRSPYDFVLWKKVPETEKMAWSSPFSYGRPGWHIECSAMSARFLGMNFDIHGGGRDLQFPHHENEIAQSECAFPGKKFANYWVHNGFLTIEGEKMSKSLGNFKTIKDIREQGFSGLEIRLALLGTHYQKPLVFSSHLLHTSAIVIKNFNKMLDQKKDIISDIASEILWDDIPFLGKQALLDNINIAKFIALMHRILNDIKRTVDLKEQKVLVAGFYKMGKLIGIFP